ncbi:MAG: hypothetical protein NUV51_00840 [Sulfuricaulis sp.]|nr:hypothetical protein [Sulfuricaulis sp.]
MTDAEQRVREALKHWPTLIEREDVRALLADRDEREAKLRAALQNIMHNADAMKEPCGTDPESSAAIRNGKLASLAMTAAQALGIVRGPEIPAESEREAKLRAERDALAKALEPFIGYAVHYAAGGIYTLDVYGRDLVAARAALAQIEKERSNG